MLPRDATAPRRELHRSRQQNYAHCWLLSPSAPRCRVASQRDVSSQTALCHLDKTCASARARSSMARYRVIAPAWRSPRQNRESFNTEPDRRSRLHGAQMFSCFGVIGRRLPSRSRSERYRQRVVCHSCDIIEGLRLRVAAASAARFARKVVLVLRTLRILQEPHSFTISQSRSCRASG